MSMTWIVARIQTLSPGPDGDPAAPWSFVDRSFPMATQEEGEECLIHNAVEEPRELFALVAIDSAPQLTVARVAGLVSKYPLCACPGYGRDAQRALDDLATQLTSGVNFSRTGA